MSDLIENAEDEVFGVRVLAQFRVHQASDAKAVRIAELIGRDDPRPYRRMSVERFAEHPLRRPHLPIARGDIVARAITEHDFPSALRRNVLASLADYDDQLGFVVGHLRSERQLNRIEGTVDRGDGL